MPLRLLSQIKAVLAIPHRGQTCLGRCAQTGAEKQEAMACDGAAPYSAAELVQLCKPQAFCIFDHHIGCVWHIDPDLDYGCRHQNIDFTGFE